MPSFLVRLTYSDHLTLVRASRQLGMTVSAYVRERIANPDGPRRLVVPPDLQPGQFFSPQAHRTAKSIGYCVHREGDHVLIVLRRMGTWDKRVIWMEVDDVPFAYDSPPYGARPPWSILDLLRTPSASLPGGPKNPGKQGPTVSGRGPKNPGKQGAMDQAGPRDQADEGILARVARSGKLRVEDHTRGAARTVAPHFLLQPFLSPVRA